jgi:hypothetical protein
MSQVQTPKPKPYKKVMNTPTNSIEMTPLKVMNAAEKEWDQLDTWLARYDQNSEQILLLKIPDGHVRPWIGYIRFRWIYPVNEPDMSGLPRNFLPNFDS